MRYPRMDVEATRWPRSSQSKPLGFGKKRVIFQSKQIFDPPFRPQGGLGWKKKVHQSIRTWILCPTWVFQIIRRRFRRAIEDSFREIKRCKYDTISRKRYAHLARSDILGFWANFWSTFGAEGGLGQNFWVHQSTPTWMRYPRVGVEATRWPRSSQSKPSGFGKKRVILHSKQIFDPPFRRQGGLGWKKKFTNRFGHEFCARPGFYRSFGDVLGELSRIHFAK